MDGERTEGSEVRPEEAGDEAEAGGHGGFGGADVGLDAASVHDLMTAGKGVGEGVS